MKIETGYIIGTNFYVILFLLVIKTFHCIFYSSTLKLHGSKSLKFSLQQDFSSHPILGVFVYYVIDLPVAECKNSLVIGLESKNNKMKDKERIRAHNQMLAYTFTWLLHTFQFILQQFINRIRRMVGGVNDRGAEWEARELSSNFGWVYYINCLNIRICISEKISFGFKWLTNDW